MKQILIAIDQLANTIIGGWADETLSSHNGTAKTAAPQDRFKGFVFTVSLWKAL